jgi:hypothetical protein
MEYTGEVFCGNKFVGNIYAKNFATLKRKASKLCNNYCKSVDTIKLYLNCREDAFVTFTRINRVFPNNEIVRGTWK